MTRCTKCILPETYPEIAFDSKGVCNYCHQYEPIKYLGRDNLNSVLNRYRRNDDQPDCLVAVSGGRDSTYVLYQLRETFGMRPLAFNYNNGFVSDPAQKNIEMMTQKLDIPLVSVSSRRGIQEKMFKSFLEFNARKSPAHVLNQICVGCRHGIWGGAYKTAAERGIQLLVFGESKIESMVFRRILAQRLEPQLSDKVETTLKMPVNFLRRKLQERRLNREFPLIQERYRPILKINYFDYIEWNEDEIVNTLRGIGWQADQQNTWRFDCQIHALGNYLNQQLYGFTEKDELYSRMIREGLSDRQSALHKVETAQQNRKTELDTIETLMRTAKIKPRIADALLDVQAIAS
ncbi:hypothetical protein GF407_20525 [candidate division KSB1 bacterium]|nr:hypothetical protein [candidate division KSB1 bacterium]